MGLLAGYQFVKDLESAGALALFVPPEGALRVAINGDCVPRAIPPCT